MLLTWITAYCTLHRTKSFISFSFAHSLTSRAYCRTNQENKLKRLRFVSCNLFHSNKRIRYCCVHSVYFTRRLFSEPLVQPRLVSSSLNENQILRLLPNGIYCLSCSKIKSQHPEMRRTMFFCKKKNQCIRKYLCAAMKNVTNVNVTLSTAACALHTNLLSLGNTYTRQTNSNTHKRDAEARATDQQLNCVLFFQSQ